VGAVALQNTRSAVSSGVFSGTSLCSRVKCREKEIILRPSLRRRLSSDGGVLALREIERRLGIADRLAGYIEDPRAPGQVSAKVHIAMSLAGDFNALGAPELAGTTVSSTRASQE